MTFDLWLIIVSCYELSHFKEYQIYTTKHTEQHLEMVMVSKYIFNMFFSLCSILSLSIFFIWTLTYTRRVILQVFNRLQKRRWFSIGQDFLFLFVTSTFSTGWADFHNSNFIWNLVLPVWSRFNLVISRRCLFLLEFFISATRTSLSRSYLIIVAFCTLA